MNSDALFEKFRT